MASGKKLSKKTIKLIIAAVLVFIAAAAAVAAVGTAGVKSAAENGIARIKQLGLCSELIVADADAEDGIIALGR